MSFKALVTPTVSMCVSLISICCDYYWFNDFIRNPLGDVEHQLPKPTKRWRSNESMASSEQNTQYIFFVGLTKSLGSRIKVQVIILCFVFSRIWIVKSEFGNISTEWSISCKRTGKSLNTAPNKTPHFKLVLDNVRAENNNNPQPGWRNSRNLF